MKKKSRFNQKGEINIPEIAKKIAIKQGFPTAKAYNMVLRESDGIIEIIGLINDPNVDPGEVKKERVVYPECWITLGTIPASQEIKWYN